MLHSYYKLYKDTKFKESKSMKAEIEILLPNSRRVDP